MNNVHHSPNLWALTLPALNQQFGCAISSKGISANNGAPLSFFRAWKTFRAGKLLSPSGRRNHRESDAENTRNFSASAVFNAKPIPRLLRSGCRFPFTRRMAPSNSMFSIRAWS